MSNRLLNTESFFFAVCKSLWWCHGANISPTHSSSRLHSRIRPLPLCLPHPTSMDVQLLLRRRRRPHCACSVARGKKGSADTERSRRQIILWWTRARLQASEVRIVETVFQQPSAETRTCTLEFRVQGTRKALHRDNNGREIPRDSSESYLRYLGQWHRLRQ